MLLSEKVKEILSEAGSDKANSSQSCQYIADRFYCQYEANPYNYKPLKEYVLDYIK